MDVVQSFPRDIHSEKLEDYQQITNKSIKHNKITIFIYFRNIILKDVILILKYQRPEIKPAFTCGTLKFRFRIRTRIFHEFSIVTICSWMIDTSDEFRTLLQYWLGELIIEMNPWLKYQRRTNASSNFAIDYVNSRYLARNVCEKTIEKIEGLCQEKDIEKSARIIDSIWVNGVILQIYIYSGSEIFTEQ